MPESVDVAIIGGGVMGCALAWRLAESGVACAVVERGRFGGGASGATAGIVAPLWHIDPGDPAMFGLGMRSLELFPQWAAALADAGVNPEFQPTGVLRLAFSDAEVAELAQSFRWQSELDLGVQWLEREDLLRREPQANPQAQAAVFSPQEGCVRGQRLTDALAHAAGRRGAILHENVEVTGLRHAGNRITGLETTIGGIAAGQVVLAAGPWSGLGPRWSIPGSPRPLPVRGVKGQRILLRRPGFLPQSATHNFTAYVAPRLDGTVLVASTREEGRFDETVTADAIAHLVSAAVRSFPALAGASYVAGRAGVRPATPDGRPIIGPAPGADGLTIITGHDAVGIMLYPATTELAAQYLLDGNAAPLAPFRADRFG